jgi:hypothetical protein
MELQKLKSGKLYSGTISTFVPQGKMFKVVTDGKVTLKSVDQETGEEKILGLANNGQIKKRSSGAMTIQAAKNVFWFPEFQDDDVTYDPADDMPLETNVAPPMTTMEKMKAMIREQLLNEFGNSNQEYETLEEALDLDIDGDGDIGLTQYNPQPMVEEEPAPPEEPQPPQEGGGGSETEEVDQTAESP